MRTIDASRNARFAGGISGLQGLAEVRHRPAAAAPSSRDRRRDYFVTARSIASYMASFSAMFSGLTATSQALCNAMTTPVSGFT